MADRENPSEKTAGKDALRGSGQAGATKALRSIERAQRAIHHSFRFAGRAALHRRKFRRTRSRKRNRLSGRVSVYARHLSHDVSRPTVDDAAVRGIWHGGGIESALSLFAQHRGRAGFRSRSICRRRSGWIPITRCALGEVGKVGVAIDSLEDMETLFDGIPLERVSTSMTINSTAAILLCAVRRGGEEAGRRPAKTFGHGAERHFEGIHRARHVHLSGAAGDAHRDRYFRVVPHRIAEVEHDFDFRLSHSRGGLDGGAGSGVHAGGCDRVCARRRLHAGLAVDEFAPQLSFFFNAHSDLLEEIAKYRAARRLWARIMTERFAARDPRSLMLRFHAQTAGSSLTAQQPENNIVRVAIQALAAVLGGCQSLHTNALDEALALPTEDAALLALRTQQIIAHETGVANTVDPVGGSYAIEKLTDEIEARRASNTSSRIDAMGGMLRAIETGLRAGRNSEGRVRISARRREGRADRRRRERFHRGKGKSRPDAARSIRKSKATRSRG